MHNYVNDHITIVNIYVNDHIRSHSNNVIYNLYFFGRQHRKDIDLYLKPFRGNNNIINLNTSYEKNIQLSSNKYLLLFIIIIIYPIYILCCSIVFDKQPRS